MLKKLIRIICTDAGGLLVKILVTVLVAAVAGYFIFYTVLFGQAEGGFGLFGSVGDIALDQAPWVDIGTVSAWEVYELENLATLILYIGAQLLYNYGLWVGLAIALVWLLVRLLTRQKGKPESTLRYLTILGIIQMAIPILYGLIILILSKRFAVSTWVHTPLLEAEPGNVLLCVLIPLGYLLICTALQY
ncbi:MAG: hypothetical protein IJC46_02225, partial [Clostridia bacterium]|nr:hypothetical protein [Clostridia bacterium]